jgi:hypothetical protein
LSHVNESRGTAGGAEDALVVTFKDQCYCGEEIEKDEESSAGEVSPWVETHLASCNGLVVMMMAECLEV